MTRAAPIEARPDAERAPARGLILASRSPQRRAILEQLGVEFSVVEPEVDELVEGEPWAVAAENARRKAAGVPAPTGAAVLAVDTVVCLGQRIYDKPRDAGGARATLAALSGRCHTVISGVCLVEDGEARTGVARTQVEFRELEASMVDWYVASGEWADRAGGYAIQGRGAALVKAIEGDYFNVVGLPVATLLELAPWLLYV
jgi:septum formation protein